MSFSTADATPIPIPAFQPPCDAAVSGYCVSTEKAEGERKIITGSLWSPNIGWVNLNYGIKEYEVTISVSGEDRGHLYGYGWNPVFGWLYFEDPGHKDENGKNRSMVFVDPKNADIWAGKTGTKPDGKTIKDTLYGNLFAPGFGFIFLDPNNKEAPSTVTVQTVDEGKADGAAPSEAIGWVFFNTLPEGSNQLGENGKEIPQSFDITFDGTPPSKLDKGSVELSYLYRFKDKTRGTFEVRKKIDDTGYINISNMQAFEPSDVSNPDGEGESPIKISFKLESWSDAYKVYYLPASQLTGGNLLIPGMVPEPVEIPYTTNEKGEHIYTLSDVLWTHSGNMQLVNLQVKIINFSTKQASYDTIYIKNHKPVLATEKNQPGIRMSTRSVNKQTGGMTGSIGDLMTTTVVVKNVADPIKARKYCYDPNNGNAVDCVPQTGLNECAQSMGIDTACIANTVTGTKVAVYYETVENDLKDVLDERFPNPFMELAPEDLKLTVNFSSNRSGFESAKHFAIDNYKEPSLVSIPYSIISDSDKKDIITSPNLMTFLPGKYSFPDNSFNFSLDHNKSIQLNFTTRIKATP